jgi:hypothetical protein
MSSIPKYLMDENGFYFNPEDPESGLIFNGPITIEQIKKVRIPVWIYRGGELVVPGDEIPTDVKEDTLDLR